MPTTLDNRVDAYIEKAAPFARPILEKIRRAFHRGSPHLVETIKWGTPHFEMEGLLGGMAAFKAHVTFTLWKGKELEDPHGLFAQVGATNMAAVKVTAAGDLPTQAVLRDYIKRATALNAVNAKAARQGKAKAPAKRKPAPKMPPELAAALKKNAQARATFESFPPSAKRDYIEWITGAKREATRAARLTTTMEWLREGKRRNWKYESC